MASVPDQCSESRVGAARNSQDARLPFPCEVSAIHELATLEAWVRQHCCTANALADSHDRALSRLVCHPSFGALDYTRTTSRLPHVHALNTPFVCTKGCLSVDSCNCWGRTPSASAIQTWLHQQQKKHNIEVIWSPVLAILQQMLQA